MVASLDYTSPDAYRKQIERQTQLNATLAAQKAAKAELNKTMPMPGIQAGPPPSQPGGPLPLPGMASMGGMPPPVGAAPPLSAPPALPSLPDPAGDPTVPPPTPPMVPGMGQSGPMSAGMGQPTAIPQFAEGGVVDDGPPPPFAPTADQIMQVALRLKRGEKVDPQELLDPKARRLLNQPPATATMPVTGSQTGVTAPSGAGQVNLPQPPRAFVEWLSQTDPASTNDLGKTLLDVFGSNPEAAPELWALVREFVAAPSDEGEELPPDLAAIVGGKKPAAPMPERRSMPKAGAKSMPLPGADGSRSGAATRRERRTAPAGRD